jgi:hypothetical protein
MIQTVTYTEVDAMFYETLRSAVVTAGYIPDVANYPVGKIVLNVLGAGGTDYVINDTFTVDGGSILATGRVLSVLAGVVVTYELLTYGSTYATGLHATTNTLGAGIGLTINVTSVLTAATAATAYEAAKTALRATTMLTEVFNTGSFEAKGEKSINKIVIIRGSDSVGSIGGFPATEFTSEDVEPYTAETIFTKQFLPDNTENINYEIKIITNDSKWDNILSHIIRNVIPQKRNLFTVDATGNYTTKSVLIVSMGSRNISAFNFIERTYMFQVKDVFIQSPIFIDTMPAMSTVEYYVYSQPDMTNELDHKLIEIPHE